MIRIHGATLSGVAAAVRLAKVGHTVELIDSGQLLGGDPERVAAAWRLPTEFAFPAPLRDLFRKSGRVLDAELARAGHALVPVPSRTVPVPGAEPLTYPAERGAQFAALEHRFGRTTAAEWRDLLDGLAEVWQARRALGLEHEFSDDKLTELRPRLLWGRSLGELADTFDHPVLSGLIVDAGRTECPDDPRAAPASEAIWLTVERTFGRWRIVSDTTTTETTTDEAGAPTVTGPALAAALQARLSSRKVRVVAEASDPAGADVEAVVLTDEEIPRVPLPRTWRPGSWRGPRSRMAHWYERPGPRLGTDPATVDGPPRYLCGASTPSGRGIHGQILSAALVAYAAQWDLRGKNIHPTYKGP